MAVLTLAGVDVEGTLGAVVTDLGAILDTAIGVQGEVPIPSMPGALLTGPFATPVRQVVIKLYLDGVSQAVVRANLHTLQALLGDPDVVIPIVIADWNTVQINARCTLFTVLNFPVGGSRANSQNEIPVDCALTFRSSGTPFWSDVSPQSIGFTSSPVAMPQGTAPSEPVLTTDTTAAAADTLLGKDYLGNTLWSATLAARAGGERYRITTALGVMTIEKFTGGVWINADASLTAGVFPKPLPSSGVGYQSSTWPTLQSSTGSWTAAYPKRWR